MKNSERLVRRILQAAVLATLGLLLGHYDPTRGVLAGVALFAIDVALGLAASLGAGHD